MSEEPAEVLVPIGAIKASAWFLENSLDIFLGVQGETLIKVLPTWTRLTGWASADCEKRPFLDFIHPDDHALVRERIFGLTIAERALVEHRLKAASGEWLWMRTTAVKGADGWLLMILRDITEDKQRETEADQARSASEMLRKTAGVTTWRYNPDLDRYDINPDFSHPAGGASAEAKLGGELVRSVVHKDDAPLLHLAWTHGLTTGEAQVAEYRERGPDGAWRRMRVSWQGVKPAPSGRWEMLGIAQDVTDLTEARDAAMRGQQEAQAAVQAKSQFLANMSHEIRTPMNGLMGFLHLIKADPSPHERQRLVDEALAAGASLTDLLASIIDYADIETGRLQLNLEAIDPEAELREVARQFQSRAAAKGLRLKVSCARGLGAVQADPARLRQIFYNLVGNAVKFTDTGHIDVRLSHAGEGLARRLRFEVEDTGIGVPAEAQAALFERFSQGDASNTRRYGGSGLGLAITKRLAELMGGLAGITSKVGKGSTFWVEISAPAAAPPQPQPTMEGDGQWLAGLKVLVVEDNPTNLLVATRMLGMLGAEVETAENGAEGVAAVERTDFDLIFMDIQMPVMDGVEASRQIRAMQAPKCDTPIVATTANVMPQQLAAYRGCGMNGVVAKPISPSSLLAEISRLAGAANDEGEEAQLSA